MNKDNIKKILRIFIKNKKIKKIIVSIYNQIYEHIFLKKFFNFYKNKLDKIDPEIKEVFDFLSKNKFNLFPYEFIKKYKPENINIYTDNENGLKYGFWNDKKIYFKRSCDDKEAKNILCNLLLAQDDKSPHKYLTNEFNVSGEDVIVDAGAAEGEFTLSVIDKIKKAYIFEADIELLEALKETFKPWKDKVIIVNKYISNKDSANTITLDNFIRNTDYATPSFIKVDIEGFEYDFIQGAINILKKDNIKLIMATYHKHMDEIILKDELQKYGFKTEYSNGYMLSIWDHVIKPPFIRRALIRAYKA